MDHLRRLVIRTLYLADHPTTPRRLLDIGGGTGNFTRLLLTANPTLEAIVVDPFLVDDEEHDNQNPRLRFVQAGAEVFAEDHHTSVNSNHDANHEALEWRRDYHHVLLKEVVHHLQDRVTIFKGMREGLAKNDNADDGGAIRYPHLLIMTRPQIEIDYPLWPAACDVWAANQPSHDALIQELYRAGFSRVHYSLESYPCQIALPKWQSMVKRRFWSTFSNFTDNELDRACNNMSVLHADRLDDEGNLTFEDRLVFLTAWK